VNRGEPPQTAVLRELAEEVGLAGGTARFFALYRIRGAAVNFRPNLEISEICFADPHPPPQGCTPATLRRLQEQAGAAEPSHHW